VSYMARLKQRNGRSRAGYIAFVSMFIVRWKRMIAADKAGEE